MKKIILLLCAIACTVGAFAQSIDNPLVTDVTFSVPNQHPVVDEDEQEIKGLYTIDSVDSTVTISFEGYNQDEVANLGLTPWLMTVSGSGFAVEPNAEPLFLEGGAYTMSLKDVWGNPYMGTYSVTLIVCFMDAEGDLYMVDDEPLFFQVVYSTENKTIKLASVYPNNDWSEETFAEAYNRSEIRFNFTNELSLDEGDIIGKINYTRFDGDDVDSVDIIVGINAEAGWNPMDGYYTITINYALEGVVANELSEVKIYLDTLKSPYGDVTVKPVTLQNDNTNVKKISKKAKIASGLAVGADKVSVYNVAGILVKDNISLSEVNDLPKGLYIVNGKKVVVK